MHNNNYKAVNSLDKQSLRGKKDQKEYDNTMTASCISYQDFIWQKITFN